jgi:hypothetical protein
MHVDHQAIKEREMQTNPGAHKVLWILTSLFHFSFCRRCAICGLVRRDEFERNGGLEHPSPEQTLPGNRANHDNNNVKGPECRNASVIHCVLNLDQTRKLYIVHGKITFLALSFEYGHHFF